MDRQKNKLFLATSSVSVCIVMLLSLLERKQCPSDSLSLLRGVVYIRLFWMELDVVDGSSLDCGKPYLHN